MKLDSSGKGHCDQLNITVSTVNEGRVTVPCDLYKDCEECKQEHYQLEAAAEDHTEDLKKMEQDQHIADEEAGLCGFSYDTNPEE